MDSHAAALSGSRSLLKNQQAELDCSDDFATEWQLCKVAGESWGGRGRGGRGVARQYACTSSATRDVRVDNVTLAYSGLELLGPCALRISHGQRYALIGRNGCGKTSFLERIASGSLPGFPPHLRVAILHQLHAHPASDSLSAVDVCLQLGAQNRRWDLEDEREQLQTAMSNDGASEDADIAFIVQVRARLAAPSTRLPLLSHAAAFGRHRPRARRAHWCFVTRPQRRSSTRIGLQRLSSSAAFVQAQRRLAHARSPGSCTPVKTRHFASG